MTLKGELCDNYISLIEEDMAENLFSTERISSGSGNMKNLSYKEKDTVLSKGNKYEYLSENIYYQYIKLNQSASCSTMLKMPHGFVQMIFCINGSCRYKKCANDLSRDFEIESQHHNIIYFGNQEVEVQISPKDTFEGLAIYIKLSHFSKYTLPHFPKLEEFHHQISLCKRGICQLSKKNLSLNHKLALGLHQLLEERTPEATRYYFVEAKVAELLMLQWSFLIKKECLLENIPLKEKEIEKMYQVKNILINNMHKDLTLKSIAHDVGTNEYNLKKHFKIVFGETVFGFLHGYKMEIAKSRLLDPKLKISELAEKLGYKHATHFSAAYKKHFGELPRPRKTKAIS